MRTTIIRNCQVCGEPFSFPPSQLAHRDPKYCSRRCLVVAKGAAEHPCPGCSKPMKRLMYCSASCRRAHESSPEQVALRFWSKVNKSGPVPAHVPELGPCWIWTRSRDAAGYGQFNLDGRCQLAHRVAWFLTHGRWPEPQALHRCDGGAIGCVRLDHLYEGNDLSNAHDKLARGRWRSGAKGMRNGLAKLSDADIPQIRAALAAGESKASLGRRYGVDPGAIRQIELGRTWRHV